MAGVEAGRESGSPHLPLHGWPGRLCGRVSGLTYRRESPHQSASEKTCEICFHRWSGEGLMSQGLFNGMQAPQRSLHHRSREKTVPTKMLDLCFQLREKERERDKISAQ